MKAHIYRARTRWPLRRNQPWYIQLVFDNGRVFAHSERYTNKAAALRALNTAKRELADAAITTEDT